MLCLQLGIEPSALRFLVFNMGNMMKEVKLVLAFVATHSAFQNMHG
jgi:hypothetical protein